MLLFICPMLICAVKLVSAVKSHLVNVSKHLFVLILRRCVCVRVDGQGGWNSHGCETRIISVNETSCFCDHLTSFAVLLVSHKNGRMRRLLLQGVLVIWIQGDTVFALFQDISRAPMSEKDREILTVISYLGCGISSLFLGFTLLTYLAFGWVYCTADSSQAILEFSAYDPLQPPWIPPYFLSLLLSFFTSFSHCLYLYLRFFLFFAFFHSASVSISMKTEATRHFGFKRQTRNYRLVKSWLSHLTDTSIKFE